MKRKPRNFDIFNLSFLDVISCGFGAVVLLVLVANTAPPAGDSTEAPPAASLLSQVLEAESAREAAQRALARARETLRSKQQQLAQLRAAVARAQRRLQSGSAAQAAAADELAGLSLVKESLQRAALSRSTAEERDAEVGGIPVDADYVVFIVDTSGSMQQIWPRVVAQVENVIRIHPKIKGFQIMNDNGKHLLSAFRGRWIPDTKGRREAAIRLLRNWRSVSNSSPVEGLQIALKRYAKANVKLSIYIFGDDYSGGSYDLVLDTLEKLNTQKSGAAAGKPLAKIHAVGFLSPNSNERFATLMREATHRNGGAFLALPR